MKIRCIVTSALILLTAFAAQAIDRDAERIHSASIVFSDLDDIDSVAVSLLAEDALEAEQWAVLFNVAYSVTDPQDAEEVDGLTFGMGLKFYPIPLLGLSGMASYTFEDERNDGGREDTKSARGDAKLRLVPAGAAVSPFARGAVEYRDRSSFSDLGADDTFTELLVTLGGGVEFTMSENFSFVFEAGLVEADDSSDGMEDLDGWVGSITMQYYWHD